MIKIILADDHPLLLKGLAYSVDGQKFEIVGTASNGEEVLKILENQHADILVLDIEMPLMDGISTVKKIEELKLQVKCVLLTYHKEPGLLAFANAHELVYGYILKEDTQLDINDCLDKVSKGEYFVSSGIGTSEQADEPINLTPSEKKIIKLIAEELSTQEIAETLYISPRTVDKHRTNIQLKISEINPDLNLKSWISANKVFLGSL
ncbi:response regulator transcription factor [Jiulongibacter sp. NS-SX5]|uniref:response regulator transcription factor n=1 Tax=Jiulongibacter sp. NS-SX5 TaxID=3463854 RepID=UPI0040587205